MPLFRPSATRMMCARIVLHSTCVILLLLLTLTPIIGDCAHSFDSHRSTLPSPPLAPSLTPIPLSPPTILRASDVDPSDANPSAVTIRWTAASILHDQQAVKETATIPFIYSLFASWRLASENDIVASSTGVIGGSASSSFEVARRICRSRELECRLRDIPKKASEVRLQIMVEVDGDENGRYVPTLSPTLDLAMNELRRRRRSHPHRRPDLVAASRAIDMATAAISDRGRIATDPTVTALAQLFDCLNGAQWVNSTDWNTANDYCQWFGIACDVDSAIIGLSLPNNGLSMTPPLPSPSPVPHCANDPLSRLPSLISLDLSHNFDFDSSLQTMLDLTPLTKLTKINMAMTSTMTIRLPTSTQTLNITGTLTLLNFNDFPNIVELTLDRNRVPFGIDILMIFPKLRSFSAIGSRFQSSPSLNLTELTGGELTDYVLTQLDRFTPMIETFDIADAATLAFSTDQDGTRWPRIVSSSLRTLRLDGLTQLHTARSHPPLDWLSGLPKLASLSAQRLSLNSRASSVRVHLASLRHVATTLQALRLSNTFLTTAVAAATVTADSTTESPLAPLLACHRLTVIELDESNLSGAFPDDLHAFVQVWPNLSYISAQTNQLHGRLPSFVNLTSLTHVDLTSNSLTTLTADAFIGCVALDFINLANNYLGPLLPSFIGLNSLTALGLASNSFTGHLELDLPALQYFTISDNDMKSIDPLFWEKLPQLIYCDLSLNRISSLPSPSYRRWFDLFTISGNNMTIDMPHNITAVVYDLSFNTIRGKIEMFQLDGYGPMDILNLGYTYELRCPIDLSALTSLKHLEIQFGGFEGCHLQTVMTSLESQGQSLQYLDVSSNNWMPSVLYVGPLVQLEVLKLSNTNLRDIIFTSILPQLRTLEMDDNSHLLANGTFGSSFTPTFTACSSLQFFSCSNCGLQRPITHVVQEIILIHSTIYEVRLNRNSLYGSLDPTLLFHSGENSLPYQVRQLSLNRNPDITGILPAAVAGYSDLEFIDLSDTSVEGDLPPSWEVLVTLQRLVLSRTKIRCAFEKAPEGVRHKQQRETRTHTRAHTNHSEFAMGRAMSSRRTSNSVNHVFLHSSSVAFSISFVDSPIGSV